MDLEMDTKQSPIPTCSSLLAGGGGGGVNYLVVFQTHFNLNSPL